MTTLGPLLRRDRRVPIAIAPDGTAHTVDDLRAAAGAVAAALVRFAAPGHVVVACDDRLAFVQAAVGVWAAGRVVTLPSNLLPATIGERTAGATFVHDGAHDGGLQVRSLPPAAPVAFDGDLDPAVPLVRLFTSGTTGVPKAIDKCAGQLVGEAILLANTFDLAGTRVLCTVPSHHIYGLLFGVLLPLVAGATIVAVPALHAESVREAIVRHGVDVVVSTPAQLRAFDVLDDGTLSGLRWVFSSGAPLGDATAALLRDRLGAVPTEVFGSSETGGIAHRTHHRPDPPWTPLAGVTVSADGDGRMLLCSPLLDPTVPQPQHTDDRITMVDGGFIHHGRLDDTLKIGGRRIALGDVTARVLAVPGIDDAVAIAMPATDGRGAAIALAVATTTRTADDVRASLTPWFDPAVLPRRIVCVPSLPRQATGKLSRQQLLALLGEPAAAVLVPRRRAVVDTRAQYEVAIDPSLPCFAGHFPGDPILPGAVLLDMVVLAAIEDAWPELGAATGVPRAKFTEPIRPGQQLRVDLVRRADRVAFTVDRDDVACATGTFVFAAARDHDAVE